MASHSPAISSSTGKDPIIRVEDLNVSFDVTRGVSKVIDDVSIDIENEEALGIVGESGSGKSMFASALIDAVVEPGQTSGEVTYCPSEGTEIDVFDLPPERLKQLRWEEISMVFQGAMSSFNPTMKIREHFVETLEAHRYDVPEGLERGKELLSEVYLDPERVMDSYPHELSGGMKQRALLSLSLLLEPQVLVMDEPTAALDLLMQRTILGLLQDLRESHDITIVFITHDLELAAKLADRLAVLYAFEFVEVGPTKTILEESRHPYTRALLRSTPSLEAPIEEMQPIEGSSPDPVNTPDGCSYHPRCPLATEECRNEDPDFLTVDENHESACFHWEDSENAVPFDEDRESYEEQDVPDEVATTRAEEARQNGEEPVISLDDVSVHFDPAGASTLAKLLGNAGTVHAVDDVSLDLYKQDVIALVGESGCGKTTLGKTTVGLQEPSSGSVKYRGQDIQEAKNSRNPDTPYGEIRRNLQIIHQDPGAALNPNRTVRANLAAPLKKWFSDMDAEDRESHIYNFLEYVGMSPPEDYADRYPHQLSGGEQQRVTLVRSLLLEPDVILADESVSALDVSLRIEMMDLFLDSQELFDTSFVFVSHNLANARYLTEHVGGRIAIMYLGEIVEIGPPQEIIQNPQHPYTKVLKWSTVDFSAEAIDTDDIPVRSIDIPDPIDPPSGCRFHTRCPEAREACKHESPQLEADGDTPHPVSCFRQYDEHEYWSSEPLGDE